MDARKFLEILSVAECLKDTTRHCYTSKGRHESVAEHTWMMSLMAFFLRDEFPEVDFQKVMLMIIIHDLGECFTGDIPAFEKNDQDRESEEKLLHQWIATIPEPYQTEMWALYNEMEAKETLEAKVYKAIDSLEALIQHNLSDLTTWTEHEKEFNLVYANDRVSFSSYLTHLRELIHQDTVEKLKLSSE
ncbi:HD domain-containing protein [Globicatella sp. PHS-GS-PNBC-21-1553]|nr:HD domain-containing protein [Globicatella sp. PHS-GS-PNBC-21-1553]WPC07813.1 HD domain-containing protein [Globicatella sp. PHS-GS-PNBC-21-1553]